MSSIKETIDNFSFQEEIKEALLADAQAQGYDINQNINGLEILDPDKIGKDESVRLAEDGEEYLTDDVGAKWILKY